MELEDLSIRARVAFGIECLERLINRSTASELNWEDLLLSKLWGYTSSDNLGRWHYLISEYTPFSILEDISFEEKEYEYITKIEYNELLQIYQKCNDELLKCIDLIFEIGTLDLYSSIKDKSPRTLRMLKEIITIIESNSLQLPDLKKYENYLIDYKNGWGAKFERENLKPNGYKLLE